MEPKVIGMMVQGGVSPVQILNFGLHPQKTNMEPENHMFEKENHLPNLHFWGSMLVFRGVFVNTVGDL